MARLPSSTADISAGMRLTVIEQSKRAGVGHIGSALSIVDMLAALYGAVLDSRPAHDPDRDRFVLSKGHAALALYAALHDGRLSKADLDTYCGDDTARGAPRAQPRGIDFSTGSLGHGPLDRRRAPRSPRGCRARSGASFALISDGECNEGSVWEAVMFAAQHRLDEPGRDRRRERPAGVRLHARRARPVAARASAGAPSAGTPTRSTATTPSALGRRCSTARARRPGRRTSSSRTRSSGGASRSWRARSTGTTGRSTTTQYARGARRPRRSSRRARDEERLRRRACSSSPTPTSASCC